MRLSFDVALCMYILCGFVLLFVRVGLLGVWDFVGLGGRSRFLWVTSWCGVDVRVCVCVLCVCVRVLVSVIACV